MLEPAKAEVRAGGNGQTGNVMIRGSNGPEVARLGLVKELKVDPNQPTPTIVATCVGLRIRTTGAGEGRVAHGRLDLSRARVGTRPARKRVTVPER